MTGFPESCDACFYVRRGSFANQPTGQHAAELDANESLRTKAISLRTKFCKKRYMNPGSKPRHERIDKKQFVQRTKRSTVGFQSDCVAV